MIEFQVIDMTCGHCAATITRAVAGIEPAAKVDIDLSTHRVRITAADEADQGQRFEAAIRDAGYTPVPAAA
jgi:copper chaperone